jgi:hypothetical protein
MVSYRRKKKKPRKTRRKGKLHLQRGAASSTAVVFTLTNGGGFGSVFNFLCRVYIYAKKAGQHFFIEHDDNWRYKYKNGWHDYFKTLKIYDPNIKYDKVEKYSHGQTGTIPEYTLGDYTACIKEVLVLNDELAKRVEEYIRSIGGSYKAVYVRRGDKTVGLAKENDAISVGDIVKMGDISKNDKVFIMTDDYSVVEDIKAILPAENIFTLTPQSSKGAIAEDIFAMSPEKKKEHGEELFISFFVFVKASRGWTDNRSNIGRLHKIYSPDTIVLYPFDENVKKITSASQIDPAWRSLP